MRGNVIAITLAISGVALFAAIGAERLHLSVRTSALLFTAAGASALLLASRLQRAISGAFHEMRTQIDEQVAARTAEITRVNLQLVAAKEAAESASVAKSDF